MNNILEYNNFGGEQYYDIKNKTFILKRNYGLFSNIMVSTYNLLDLIYNNFEIEKINLFLNEYDYELNFYPYLFNKVNNKIDLDKKDLDFFLKNVTPSIYGLGHSKNQINFNLLTIFFNTYFNPSQLVIDEIENIKRKNNLIYEKTLFIWARGTDKIGEVELPTVNDYINLIKKENLWCENIILQTDDKNIYNNFIDNNLNFKNLNVIPFSSDNRGFHVYLNHISNNDFKQKHGYDKINYLVKMLALVNIASKCSKVILYPGNLTSVIPIIKGSWENVYSFKEKNFLFL